MIAERIELNTLTDGGQTADQVADEVVAFVEGARSSLDLALYDIRLPGAVGDRVRAALEGAAARGVAVRLAYNAARSDNAEDSAPPKTEPTLIESLALPTRGIPGTPDLMHHKYAIRDREAVWTGSTNWTTDSWTRQENAIVRVFDVGVARSFADDFDDLWRRCDVDGSGAHPIRDHRVGTAEPVRAWFCPGRGPELSRRIAAAIATARRRVRIASPLLTASPIITAIDAYEGDLTGVADATQVRQVLGQWRDNPASRWKGPVLERLLVTHRFAGKRSTAWAHGTTHDFLHAKLVVADDVVFLGSFNHSRSGEQNAENVLEIHDPAMASRLARWIEELRERYWNGGWSPGSRGRM